MPTYRRLEYLKCCLSALDQQTLPPYEVIVVFRRNDHGTAEWLQQWVSQPSNYAKRLVQVSSDGVVHAMQAGTESARGAIVAFTDDDAAPLPDWLERMVTYYSDTSIGGVGGRDLIAGNTDPPVSSKRVGRLSWFGRVSGNHHRGQGSPVYTHVLKGVNMSFRKELIRLPTFLRGDGAQVHFEVYVCLRIVRHGYRLVYDPDLRVEHYLGPRHDKDQRNKFVAEAVLDAAYNQNASLFATLSFSRSVVRAVYSILVGYRAAPGFVRWLIGVARRETTVVKALWPALRGNMMAVAKWMKRELTC
ncbi:glycosyltransferase family 2 protein [Alicyclobacillus fructus]|uniref:glycosyltransferase family 2 protein n=1 Tax=Alicyclobacillus fructus TaxID=2816082 RepID=UPI0038B3C8FB